MLLPLLSGGGLLVALVGGFFAYVQAKTTARNERYKAAERGLEKARSDVQVERDKILDLRDQRIDELTEMVRDLRSEIDRLRQALDAAGVTAP
jgi:predicted  nucleic acid-binding Zn-ribbon protein